MKVVLVVNCTWEGRPIVQEPFEDRPADWREQYGVYGKPLNVIFSGQVSSSSSMKTTKKQGVMTVDLSRWMDEETKKLLAAKEADRKVIRKSVTRCRRAWERCGRRGRREVGALWFRAGLSAVLTVGGRRDGAVKGETIAVRASGGQSDMPLRARRTQNAAVQRAFWGRSAVLKDFKSLCSDVGHRRARASFAVYGALTRGWRTGAFTDTFVVQPVVAVAGR